MSEFEKLRSANRQRQLVWNGSDKSDALFRAVELGGEAGELLNAIKKLTRATRGIQGNTDDNVQKLRMDVMEEMGDVVIALDLLADSLAIDLGPCVPMKFNKTSKKNAIGMYMDEDWNPVDAEADAQISMDFACASR